MFPLRRKEAHLHSNSSAAQFGGKVSHGLEIFQLLGTDLLAAAQLMQALGHLSCGMADRAMGPGSRRR